MTFSDTTIISIGWKMFPQKRCNEINFLVLNILMIYGPSSPGINNYLRSTKRKTPKLTWHQTFCVILYFTIRLRKLLIPRGRKIKKISIYTFLAHIRRPWECSIIVGNIILSAMAILVIILLHCRRGHPNCDSNDLFLYYLCEKNGW